MSEQRTPLHDLTDEELAIRVQSGAIPIDEGLEELATRNTIPLWRYLRSQYPDIDDDYIDDAVAETLITIWEKIEQYSPEKGSKFLNWAITIARNHLRQALRKDKKYATFSALEAQSDQDDEVNILEVLTASTDIEDEIEYKELDHKALELVMSFPELDRTLFLLRSNYDLTYEELATILNNTGENTTPDAIAKRFSRMRTQLKQQFKAL